MDTKLTVRVPRHLLAKVKRYALENQTTLRKLILIYLEQIPTESDVLNHAPITRGVSGLLSSDVSTVDYKKYTEEKYG